MKTKIIYISGSEVFNMVDVRNAFETVRRELGLASDTVLFGVPVDAEDALGGKFEDVKNVVPETIPEMDTTQDSITESVEEIVKPEKPKRSKKKVTVEEITEKDVPTPIETEQPAKKDDEKEVIPILSVLGGKTDEKQEEIVDVVPNENIIKPEEITDVDLDITIPELDDAKPVIDMSIISDDSVEDKLEIVTPIKDELVNAQEYDIPVVETQSAKIQESDDDDALEKLLQSVQSLHEEKEEPELQVVENTPDETDATLEKLATEFAENQDKIVNTTKGSTRGGRIGKLKNILPFKKSKHNESSLMGDLFGWAGVAANDEEFAIPEFFPTAVKK